ncbi:MAG TPA: hypothetical protein VFW83_04430 [Bryobacteraceae bacterium]|nr:hypothetical protein [Bryobacteraceae bacterium]
MIDPSLHPSVAAEFLFELQKIFWLYLWPVLVGFVAIGAYQIYARAALMGGRNGLALFLVSSLASMVSLFGWATMARSMQVIPLYGCGVGLANVLMSRIYAVTLQKHARLRVRIPRIVWRGDEAAIQQFQQMLQGRKA